MNWKINLCIGTLILAFATHAFAQTPGTAFTYQGALSSNGVPANGSYDMTFDLYTNSTGGDLVGEPVTLTNVGVTNGEFTVSLDFFFAFVATPTTFWLDIQVRPAGSGNFTELSPRQQLTPTPYALYAEFAGFANNLPQNAVSTVNLRTTTSPNIGQILTVVPGGLLGWTNLPAAGSGNGWSLTGNSGTTTTNFLGTTDDNSFQIEVDGVRGWQLQPSGDAPSIVGGAPGNFIAGGVIGSIIAGGGSITFPSSNGTNAIFASLATISGGLHNSIPVSGVSATIGGGEENTAGGDNSVIGGGQGNSTSSSTSYAAIVGGKGNQANGYGSFIGGGGTDGLNSNGNQATGAGSVIGGGVANGASGQDATISGGLQNATFGNQATVGGGFQNNAAGVGSFVGGGGTDGSLEDGNSAEAPASAVVGGIGNEVATEATHGFCGGGYFNTVNGAQGTIAGGMDNDVDEAAPWGSVGGGDANKLFGIASTISGGSNNNANGVCASIPGGALNSATGNYSFAAGFNASATGNNTFVWGDGTRAAQDQGAHTFNVLATGGAYFYVSASNLGAYTYLPANGSSWMSVSDRNAKKDFQPVDYVTILDQLDSIPVERWHYKWENDSDTLNIGPMAQDFKQAFYPGRDDKGISTLEFDGVELAAIKGLNQKLKLQESENQKLETQVKHLDAENAALQSRLDKLEKLMEKQLAAN